jgi:uncharacterized damage-inducible protein DinB
MAKTEFLMTPSKEFHPIVAEYFAQMEELRSAVKEYVRDLTPEQLFWQPYEGGNSIGTLLLHLAGTEAYWVRERIGGEKLTREEWAEYGMEDYPKLKSPEGKDVSFYFGKLDAMRERTRLALAKIKGSDLARPHQVEHEGKTYTFSVRWVLHHLVDHEAHHKGQFAILRRLGKMPNRREE